MLFYSLPVALNAVQVVMSVRRHRVSYSFFSSSQTKIGSPLSRHLILDKRHLFKIIAAASLTGYIVQWFICSPSPCPSLNKRCKIQFSVASMSVCLRTSERDAGECLYTFVPLCVSVCVCECVSVCCANSHWNTNGHGRPEWMALPQPGHRDVGLFCFLTGRK